MTRLAPVVGRGFLRGGSPSGPSTPVTVPDRPGPVSVGGDHMRRETPVARDEQPIERLAPAHKFLGRGTEAGQIVSITTARLTLARIARWMAWAFEQHYWSHEATL